MLYNIIIIILNVILNQLMIFLNLMIKIFILQLNQQFLM